MRTDLVTRQHEVWPEYSLEELCSRITSGGTPSRAYPEFFRDGTWPWVKTQELQDRWLDDTEEHITDEAVANSSAKVLPANTVLLAMYGATVGQLGMLRRPMTCNQACCAFIANPSRADARFLYYLLLSNRSMLKRLATGAAQQNLSSTRIKELRFPIPPIDEQRRIAGLLGALDDKIELNRRLSETFEAMARALFKSWFVDFDPVRAKAEERATELPKEIAELLPDVFDDSELGEVPSGWRVGRFGDVVELLRDQENPQATPDATYQHYSIPAFDESRSPTSERGASIKSHKSRVPTGAVLLSKLNPEIERVWLVDVRLTDRAVCSTEFLVLHGRSEFTRAFIYCLARSRPFRRQIESLVTGTSKSHQRAQASAILEIPVIIPPARLVGQFVDVAEALIVRSLQCRRESRTLVALRDALLPRLISGHRRVANGS